MMCAWQALLSILPIWMRQDVDAKGKETLQELRLRINSPPELVLNGKSLWLDREVTQEDIRFCVNVASRYSPWAAETIRKGYITAPGGHRIGLCGEAAVKDLDLIGIREVTSICIRVARDFPGIAKNLENGTSSVLILGAPGWGKTTLLRDLARCIALRSLVAVIDERGELFPQGIARGKRMDVFTGCPKSAGVEAVLRTMGPEYIAVDEITAPEDGKAVIHAAGCGVKLLATAHAGSFRDFQTHSIYREIWERGIFDLYVMMRRDKSYCVERRALCS